MMEVGTVSPLVKELTLTLSATGLGEQVNMFMSGYHGGGSFASFASFACRMFIFLFVP